MDGTFRIWFQVPEWAMGADNDSDDQGESDNSNSSGQSDNSDSSDSSDQSSNSDNSDDTGDSNGENSSDSDNDSDNMEDHDCEVDWEYIRMLGRNYRTNVEMDVDSPSKLSEKKKEEGNQAYTAKNYKHALELYTQAIELCPQCAALYNNRSACYLMLGQHRRAVSEAMEAVRLDPKYVKGHLRLAKCHVMLGDVVRAEAALAEAAALQPQNPALATERTNLEALSRLSHELQLAWDKRDYRRALFCAERALTVASGSCWLKVRRAECLVMLARYSEAQDIVQDMLRSDSMNADALYVRGMCLYYQDDMDRAFTHFQQALRLAPDHNRAKDVYKRAKSLRSKKEDGNQAFKKGRLQEALQIYTEALEIDPGNRLTNAKLYFNRATVQARLNSHQMALADCTKAIELDPKYTKAYLRRAKCYRDLEQYEESVRDYEKVFNMEKTHENRRLLNEAKLELKKSKRKDYYKILGLSRSATEDEIKKAYRKQALVHHPDRHSSSSADQQKVQEQKFKEVGEAYSVLSDRQKRRRYDNGQDLDDSDGGFSSADFDPNNLFQAFFSGHGAQPFGFSMGGHGMGGGQQHYFRSGSNSGGFHPF